MSAITSLRDERWKVHHLSLRAAMIRQDYTSIRLGRRAAVSASLCRALSNGTVSRTTGVTLRAICDVLGITPESVADRIPPQ